MDTAEKIVRMPIIAKYKCPITPATLGDNRLTIPLNTNARKNYFRAVLCRIKNMPGVLRVYYSKAQDETVSDTIEVFLA